MSTTASNRPTSYHSAKGGYIPNSRALKAKSIISNARPAEVNMGAKKSGFAPREPRIQTESLRDLADFLRSTAPDKEPEVLPIVSPGARRSPSSSTQSLSGQSRSPGPSGHNGTSSPSNKAQMAARSPARERSNTSELIDAIRQGPPDGSHRISRSVAPFRDSTDSNILNMLSDGRSPADLTPRTSTVGSRAPSNSRSPLANTTSATVQPAHSGQPSRLTSSMLAPPEPNGPVRTRRRIKDPYAIDTDDEDEDLLTALPSKAAGHPPTRQEESLADFLRSTEPPSNNAPLPVLGSASGARPHTNSSAVPSASSSRTATPGQQARGAPNGMTNGISPAAAAGRGAPRPPNPISTFASGTYKPSGAPQIGATFSPVSARAPQLPQLPPQITSNVTGGGGPAPRPKQKMMSRPAGAARDAKSDSRQNTNDLADFLRSSGPDAPRSAAGGNKSGNATPTGAPAPSVPREKDASAAGGKKGKFWKRKTYLDMP
ncbi:hypothetical protein LTS18_005566 [Coniosporium uncinatum]|uniref:Uncharacterized protein n=1 Tax=Coniosporium uncinatum TaxID=93489 RepID=A0ACC3DRE7_9PEZI|nr:hypothetical protein LTS18_005566 [Coniosporium uncinatum]